MGAEDDGGARRNLIQLVDKNRAFFAQAVADELVMHDFVPDVDRCAEFFDGAFNDGDGAFDAGAEAARVGEDDFHEWTDLNVLETLRPSSRGRVSRRIDPKATIRRRG
ncbi:hypothetical protein SDC9_189228 [bioreactor metagenome]|uniref:Uncharacterized protein n=1 Tax=bioreactor metagenome TaxID=1076179 RepID=A0A645HZU2_9ZZZZ